MKTIFLKILHYILGYDTYLLFFSVFKIQTLWLDNRKWDFLFFEKLVPEDATIVVVGACTGITTIPLAKHRLNRNIYAYEPLSSNFKALNKIVTYYGLTNIHLFNIGLSNKTEQKELILPIINGVKKQGMAHVNDPSIKEYNDGICEMVSLDRLDNQIELHSPKISGMKIVAENFELQIIEGAGNLIKKNKPLIYCELWQNDKRQAVLDLLETYDYNIFYNQKGQLKPYKPSEYSGKNFFFKSKHE